jgi:hypothetical protein
MVTETICGYEVSFTRNNEVELIFTKVFPDDVKLSPKYHGGLTLFSYNSSTVYTAPEIANLFNGPACIYAGNEKFGVNVEFSPDIKYLIGIGINEEIYRKIPSKESKFELEYKDLEFGMKVKPAVIRPLPIPSQSGVSKALSYFRNNP